MANKFNVASSPHVHSKDSVEKNMRGVVIALIPALIASFYYFGWNAVVVTLTSVAACLLFEALINKYLLKSDRLTIKDGSAVITGVLLAFNLPSSLPLWMVIIGALVAIGIGKMTFGGLGNNPFNPALVGRVFLLISFPVAMTTWPAAENSILSQEANEVSVDAETQATPLALMKDVVKYQVAVDNSKAKIEAYQDSLAGSPSNIEVKRFSKEVKLSQATMLTSQKKLESAKAQLPTRFEMLIGQTKGSMGEISAIALLLGLAYLLYRKIITWHIPVSIVVTSFVVAGFFHLCNPQVFVAPEFHLLSGGLLLGAIFMATDYATSPMSPKGMLVFGVAIGFLTIVIRSFGAYPEGLSFAILIMNAFVPLINNYYKPKRFGRVAKK